MIKAIGTWSSFSSRAAFLKMSHCSGFMSFFIPRPVRGDIAWAPPKAANRLIGMCDASAFRPGVKYDLMGIWARAKIQFLQTCTVAQTSNLLCRGFPNRFPNPL